MTSTITKKQHYIPAAQIGIFCGATPEDIPRTIQVGTTRLSKNGWLHFYKKAEGIGFANMLYEQYSNYVNEIEHLFHESEGRITPILHKICQSVNNQASSVTLSEEEHVHLGKYLFLLTIRQPHTLGPTLEKLVGLGINKVASQVQDKDLADFIRNINDNLPLLFPVSRIIVTADSAPLCLSVPFYELNRQMQFPITPKILLTIHVEITPQYTTGKEGSKSISIPIWHERESPIYSIAERNFIHTLGSPSNQTLGYVYPKIEAEHMKDFFERIDSFVNRWILLKGRLRYVDLKNHILYQELILPGKEYDVMQSVMNDLNTKDMLYTDSIRLARTPDGVNTAFPYLSMKEKDVPVYSLDNPSNGVNQAALWLARCLDSSSIENLPSISGAR